MKKIYIIVSLMILVLVCWKTSHSNNSLHPILASCLNKRNLADEEFNTFFKIAWIYTVENNKIIWKLLDSHRALLFYKISILIAYGDCLERGIRLYSGTLLE